MSERNSWDMDFPETPESFRLALKQQVEKEITDDENEDKANAGMSHANGKVKKQNEQNKHDKRSRSNASRRRWQSVKVAAAALALIGIISGGVYAVTKSDISLLVGREVDETNAESYLTMDTSAFNQTVTPGWPQTMIDIYGEDRASEIKGIEEPLLNVTQVYYDGLSLAFYAKPTSAGKKYNLNADRLVIGDAVYMIQFYQLPDEYIKEHPELGLEKGDYRGTVELGGREIPDSFTASLVESVDYIGTQTISFDVKLDENAVIKPKKTVTISNGIQASVDVLKIAASGTYIHVTWEFDESQKSLYDQFTGGEETDQILFMALDDNNGNHFTTEENGDTSQAIVITADGDDWSGAENSQYEKDGKYYYETYSIIEGMNQDIISLTVTPYVRTGVEDGEEPTYTNLDFAAFTAEYGE